MYIHCNFRLYLHTTLVDMEENVSGCFFPEHSVLFINCNYSRICYRFRDIHA